MGQPIPELEAKPCCGLLDAWDVAFGWGVGVVYSLAALLPSPATHPMGKHIPELEAEQCELLGAWYVAFGWGVGGLGVVYSLVAPSPSPATPPMSPPLYPHQVLHSLPFRQTDHSMASRVRRFTQSRRRDVWDAPARRIAVWRDRVSHRRVTNCTIHSPSTERTPPTTTNSGCEHLYCFVAASRP